MEAFTLWQHGIVFDFVAGVRADVEKAEIREGIGKGLLTTLFALFALEWHFEKRMPDDSSIGVVARKSWNIPHSDGREVPHQSEGTSRCTVPHMQLPTKSLAKWRRSDAFCQKI